MSGNPNWNPPLQTSSVRFPRKAVETPTVPANSTTRQRPGASFQPVFSTQITQVPPIFAAVTGSGSLILSNALYTISSSYGDALPYNVTRSTVRGVPAPQVKIVASTERYLVFGVTFPYTMTGTDHFVFTFKNIATNEILIKNYQQAPQYLVGGILPGVLYTLTVAPYVNGITYPASVETSSFSITAISEKNIRLSGVTISGADKAAYILFTDAIPRPPNAIQVTTLAVDDNFGSAQQILTVIPDSPGAINSGYVQVANLTNGSSYVFTVRAVRETDGVFEYGQPTALLPYIPGPPSDLYFTSITANVTTAFVNAAYDIAFHPTPVSNTMIVYQSTFSTLCSYVSQPTTTIQDLSLSYAAFTTSTSLFTSENISSMLTTISAIPGSIQVEIGNNLGLWYTFPLSDISTGGLGYTFGNSNFVKTVGLLGMGVSSYTVYFHNVFLATTPRFTSNYQPPRSSFIISGLNQTNYTFVGRNYANGLPSLRPTYTTIAVGQPPAITNSTGTVGNHLLTISFSGYDANAAIPSPRPTRFSYADNYGNTYTSINSNIRINGLTDGSLYTFTISAFANGTYGQTAQYSNTPNVQTPTDLSYVISNYNVTVSFTSAVGGADFYSVANNSGQVVSIPYVFANLSANFPYIFTAKSIAYKTPIYTVSADVNAGQIQEISSGYAQFFVSPSTIPYASVVQSNIAEFVQYTYTITSSGQPVPPPIQTVLRTPQSSTYLFPVGTSLWLSNNNPITLTLSALAAGTAVTASAGGISYTVTSITTVSDGFGNIYNSFNGGPASLSTLFGQNLALDILPISNSLTFQITSMTSVYDGSGNLVGYTIQNPNTLKSIVTFSGATTYNTSIIAGVPFFPGMVPTSYSGTISSAFSLPTTPSAYVGPPGKVIITASSYFSQEIDLGVTVGGFVVPTSYTYSQVGGNISGSSTSPLIAIRGLTNGSSYSFYVNANGNQVTGISSDIVTFNLCTDAPRNVTASFSNLTASISFASSVPASDTYWMNMYLGEFVPGFLVPIQTVSSTFAGQISFSSTNISPTTNYGFTVFGVLKGISSTVVKIPAIISGPPAAPINLTAAPSSNQIIFNWSSGNVAYNETYTITEYYSNNNLKNLTGGVWSGISGLTKTISGVVTASGAQSFGFAQWTEQNLGYASFILSNCSFTDTISGKYVSNIVSLTLTQSGGATYTFPVTSVSPYNALSNIYSNVNYPKNLGTIFDPALSVSATYSYGTGPFNYGTYSYTVNANANQTPGPSTNITVSMFSLPVSGIPTVTVSGTTATILFTQTGVVGAIYTVTNNFGSNVSTSPYEFRNLLTTSAYTFTVVSANGTFTSVSSERTSPVYVGPPKKPDFVSSTYYAQTGTVYTTDTTLSLNTVFFDSGKQGTGSNIQTISHTNAIQTGSGGFWTGGNGGIKDTLSGFVSSITGVGSAVYSNEGIVDAMYQFTVTPSTGIIQVSLSSYLLTINGNTLKIQSGTQTVYSGIQNLSSFPIQVVSRSNIFGIQSGLSSFYFTTVPALTDALTISLTTPASFSDFTSYSLRQNGVATVSYGFVSQLGTVYTPTLQYAVYTPSGITYANTIPNLPLLDTTLTITPFANNVSGLSATTTINIFTDSPGIPTAVFNDTTATVTVPKVSTGSGIDTYTLLTFSGGSYYSTNTQNADGSSSYIFSIPSLANHGRYIFKAYTTYLQISSTYVNSIEYEAGHPYTFTGLTASLDAGNATTGNYTLTAVLAPGQNSTALGVNMTVSVYNGNTSIASKTLASGVTPQNYIFTVSGGAVYTLSSSALMNQVTLAGPTTTISAKPFPPPTINLTISSADIGATYRGAISFATNSPTANVSYWYGYSSDKGITYSTFTTNNTFIATYTLSYIAAVYTTVLGGTLSGSLTTSSTSNVFYGAPSNAVATYLGSNITVNWSSAPYASRYTIRETTGQLTTISNLNALTTSFVGTNGSSYVFSVRAQSAYNTDSSLLYSLPATTNQISLNTLAVSALNIDYFGSTITLSWSNIDFNYVYTISQLLGPTLTFTQLNPETNPPLPAISTLSITNVPLSNTYKFAINTTLFGISGPSTSSSSVTLSTGPMVNVSQSYFGNQYTISWNAYPQSPVTYTVQDSNGNYPKFDTTLTCNTITLAYNLSYRFQTYATYKGISGVATTLSAIYTYTNSIPIPPTTTYFQSNITVSWTAAQQADGSLYPTSYFIKDILNFPITVSGTALGTSVSIGLVGKLGSSYQFAVTPIYNGISATDVSGSVVSLFTAPPTNVVVDNSGQNLYITWDSSPTAGTVTYSISQKAGCNVMNGISSGLVSTTFLSPLTAPVLSNKAYNFGIKAVVNGISSTEVVATVCGIVYTYPPTNVGIYYLGSIGCNTLTVYWTPSFSTLTKNSFVVSANDSDGISTSFSSQTQPNDPSNYIFNSGQNAVSNHTYIPSVYAIRNNLSSGAAVVGSSICLFTPSPVFLGTGFDGNYAITVNVCAGSSATPGTRFERPDSYTFVETGNLFFPNSNSWTFPADRGNTTSTVFQIPTLAARGVTYNFSLYATLCGLVSQVDSSFGVKAVSITTVPVTASTLFASYSGTIITVSWGVALQPAALGPASNANGGYTLYVSSQGFPLTTQYTDISFQWAGGVAGGTYQFSVEATNNNVGSAIVTSANAIVTLYKPTVQFLTVTNSGDTANPSNVKMILNWFPDPNVTGETYTATLFNSIGAQLSNQILGADINTTTFNGSLDAQYFFKVVSTYKGITGDPSTAEITNTRPILTSASVLNNGTQVIVNYAANVATFFDVCMQSTNGGTVTPNSSNNSSSSFTVSSATGTGYKYTISVTAYNNGLPSLTTGLSTAIIQPNAPPSFTAGWSNTTVTASWGVTANASSYIFQAYDTNTQSFVSIQPALTDRTATFIGTLGHTFSLAVYGRSASQVVGNARTIDALTIVVPPPPSNLTLTNTGQTVIVNWSADPAIYNNYSFYVSNVNQRGVIIYSAPFALPGDTFPGAANQTYGVALYGTSLCNVTSSNSNTATINVYQPSTPFVTATNTGADIFLQWPQDTQKTCVFLVTNNYGYSNLLFPDPTGYTGSSNGWILSGNTFIHDPAYSILNTTLSANYVQQGGYGKYTVVSNDYTTAGKSYIYSVKPYYNQVAGVAVTTNQQNPIILYQPTQVGNLTAAANGNTVTLNWQDSVVYTNPEQLIQAYTLTVTPAVGSAVTCNVIGTTQTITDFNQASGILSISIVAVIPDTAYTGSKIYGTTKTIQTVIPSLDRVSIKQTVTTSPQTFDVTIPPAAGTYIWFTTTTTVGTSPPICNVFLNLGAGSQQTYRFDVSLGYSYTISAYGFPTNTGLNINSVTSATGANQLPYAATTFAVAGSTLSTSHYGNSITISWGAVSGAEQYNFQEYNSDTTLNGGTALVSRTSITLSTSHVAGKSYTYQITALTPSQTRYGNTSTFGIALSNTLNFPNASITETLTVPTAVPNLLVTQSGNNAIVSWLPPTNILNPTVLNTQYSVSMSNNPGVSVSNKSGLTDVSCQFLITSGSSYVFTIDSQYYGISGNTPLSSYTLNSIKPKITVLNVLDNGNATATLSAAANTSGNWYYLAGNPILWLDGADTTSIVQSGGGVTQWKDKSGYGNTATTAGGTITPNTQGVGFGGNGWMNIPGLTGTLSGTPFVVFAVETFTGVSTSNAIYFGDDADNETTDNNLNIGYTQAAAGGGYKFGFWNDDLTDTTVSITTTGVTRIWTNYLPSTSNRLIRRNGTLDATHTNSNRLGAFATPVIGRAYRSTGALSNYYTGVLSELLVFNTDIGPAAIQQVEGYLAWKWGLQSNLPPNHQYYLSSAWPTGVSNISVATGTQAAAGSRVSAAVKFVAPSGLIDISSSSNFIFPIPTISTYTTSDNGGNLGKSFKLNLTTTGVSGTVLWTVTPPVNAAYNSGSLSISTTSITYTFNTGVWSAGLAATFPIGSIILSNDGFLTSNAAAVTFTPPNLAITAILYNNAGILTLSTSVPAGVIPSWTYPTLNSVAGGNSNINSLIVTYGSIAPGTGYTITPGTLTNTFEGYTNSNSTAISFGAITFSISSITFIDDGNGNSATVTATYGAFSGATGTPTWTFPTTTSNGGGYYQLNRGTITTGKSITTVSYTTTQKGSNYAIAANQISLTYGGVTSNYGILLTASSANPTITSISTSYFGCVQDTPTNNSITLNLSGNIAGTWTVTKPSTINFTTSSGQGTSNAVFNFSGGSKTNAYTLSATLTAGGFTSAVSSTIVTLTQPAGAPTITGVTFSLNGNNPNGFNVATSSATNVVLGCTTTDANFATFTPILVATTTNTLLQANYSPTLTTNILYTLFAATSLNGVLGSKQTYNVVVPGAVTNVVYGSSSTSSDKSLETSNTIWISWTPLSQPSDIASRFTYSIYRGTSPPSSPSTTAPTDTLVTSSLIISTTNHQITSLPTGAQSYYIVTVYTDPAMQKFYSAGSTGITFTYDSRNYTETMNIILNIVAHFYMDVVVVGGGGGGAGWGTGAMTGGGSGGVSLYTGFTNLKTNDIIRINGPGGGGSGGLVTGYLFADGANYDPVGGTGGAIYNGTNTGGTQDGNGERVPPSQTGGGGGGGSRRLDGLFANSYTGGGAGGGGGASTQVEVTRNPTTTLLNMIATGGAGGGGNDGSSYGGLFYGGIGGSLDPNLIPSPTSIATSGAGGGAGGGGNATGGQTNTAGNDGAYGYYGQGTDYHWHGGGGGGSTYGSYGSGGSGSTQPSSGTPAGDGGGGGNGYVSVNIYYVVPG